MPAAAGTQITADRQPGAEWLGPRAEQNVVLEADPQAELHLPRSVGLTSNHTE
jgi:hypothetical protein